MTGTVLLVLGLFIVGMLLLAVEAFVLPGFGVPGVVGMGVVIFTAYYAWTELGPLWGMLLSGAALLSAMGFVVWLPKSRVGRRLTLHAEIDGVAAYDEDAKRAGLSVGTRGLASTPLRPSGFAMFGENRVEVRTDGDFVPAGVTVEVIAFKDGKTVVEPVESVQPTGDPVLES